MISIHLKLQDDIILDSLIPAAVFLSHITTCSSNSTGAVVTYYPLESLLMKYRMSYCKWCGHTVDRNENAYLRETHGGDANSLLLRD